MAYRSARSPGVSNIRAKAQLVDKAAAKLVRAYVDYLSAIDETDADQWQAVVSTALRAGLEKEQLAEAFGCSAVTIGRWKAGLNVPGLMARKAIKNELVKMLEEVPRAIAA